MSSLPDDSAMDVDTPKRIYTIDDHAQKRATEDLILRLDHMLVEVR